jgi:hypothetical protein
MARVGERRRIAVWRGVERRVGLGVRAGHGVGPRVAGVDASVGRRGRAADARGERDDDPEELGDAAGPGV